MSNKLYRVLLMCEECQKVYNGTKYMPYALAIKWYHNTLLKCTDVCRNEECGEPLIAKLEKKPE